MATIRKQSIYSSLFIYIGFAIGAINVLFLFPRFFTQEQFGLTRILMDIALIFATICTAGAIPVGFKFYPFYAHHLQTKKNDLLTLVLTTVLATCLILFLLSPVIEPIVIRKFGYRSPILVKYLYLVKPLTCSFAILTMLEVFAWNAGKTITANFIKELFFRSLVLGLIIFWIAGWMKDFDTFITFYAYLYFPPVILLMLLIIKTSKFRFQWKISNLTRRIYPMMLRYGGAYFLSALLNIIAKTNDTLIIASQSSGGLADAAIFTIATYMITVMDVPQRGMISAATPQISQAWKEKDMARLDRLYRKTALNLLIAACGIMGVVILCSPLFVNVLGPGYSGLPLLMLVLGCGKLIDLGTGLNSQILQLSKHWKIDLFTNMIFVVISILLNYALTKRMGIIGTAIGSLAAIILFNFIRFYFIKRIYGLQPFTWRNAASIGIAALIVFTLSGISLTGNNLTDTAFKVMVFLLLFGYAVIRFGLSEDLTILFDMVKIRLKGFIR